MGILLPTRDRDRGFLDIVDTCYRRAIASAKQIARFDARCLQGDRVKLGRRIATRVITKRALARYIHPADIDAADGVKRKVYFPAYRICKSAYRA